MEYSAITDIGLVREKNQDSFVTIENNYGDVLAIVADGIGGGKAGEVASSECVSYFNENFKQSGPFDSLDDAYNYLYSHAVKVNKVVYDKAQENDGYRGMGTTLTGVLICKHGNIVVNVGDSRVYGLLDNKLYIMTRDDTLINQMIDNGEITREEAISHPKKHYLVKAIGIIEKMDPDVHKVKDMDYYLCCSDGLHGMLSNDEMINIIYSDKTVYEKCEDLKDLALLKGGFDNITAVLVKK